MLIAMASAPIYFLWCWGAFDPPDVTQLPFESAAWKRADPIENHRTVRSQMVDDLKRRRLLDGLSRAELEELLGPPMADPRQAGYGAAQWHMVYPVGMERMGAWSLDDELLVIRFDSQGRVAEYRTIVN